MEKTDNGIKRLSINGLKAVCFTDETPKKILMNNIWKVLNIVITGKLQKYNRDDAKEQIWLLRGAKRHLSVAPKILQL